MSDRVQRPVTRPAAPRGRRVSALAKLFGGGEKPSEKSDSHLPTPRPHGERQSGGSSSPSAAARKESRVPAGGRDATPAPRKRDRKVREKPAGKKEDVDSAASGGGAAGRRLSPGAEGASVVRDTSGVHGVSARPEDIDSRRKPGAVNKRREEEAGAELRRAEEVEQLEELRSACAAEKLELETTVRGLGHKLESLKRQLEAEEKAHEETKILLAQLTAEKGSAALHDVQEDAAGADDSVIPVRCRATLEKDDDDDDNSDSTEILGELMSPLGLSERTQARGDAQGIAALQEKIAFLENEREEERAAVGQKLLEMQREADGLQEQLDIAEGTLFRYKMKSRLREFADCYAIHKLWMKMSPKGWFTVLDLDHSLDVEESTFGVADVCSFDGELSAKDVLGFRMDHLSPMQRAQVKALSERLQKEREIRQREREREVSEQRVQEDVTKDEVNAAFRKLLIRFHSDANPNYPFSKEMIEFLKSTRDTALCDLARVERRRRKEQRAAAKAAQAAARTDLAASKQGGNAERRGKDKEMDHKEKRRKDKDREKREKDKDREKREKDKIRADARAKSVDRKKVAAGGDERERKRR